MDMNKKLCVFLDRDGIINVDKGYVYKISDFEFVPNIFDFIHFLNCREYYIFIVTNQSGVERGYYSENDIKILHDYMLNVLYEKGLYITGISYCPHLYCNCRKPNNGMLNNFIKKYNLYDNPKIMIGDKETDIMAGYRTKAFTIQMNKEKTYKMTNLHVNNLLEIIENFKIIEENINYVY